MHDPYLQYLYMPQPFTTLNRIVLEEDAVETVDKIRAHLTNTDDSQRPDILLTGYNVRMGWWGNYTAFAEDINEWLAADTTRHTLIVFSEDFWQGGEQQNMQTFWNIIFGSGRITHLSYYRDEFGRGGGKLQMPQATGEFANDPILTGKGPLQSVAPFGSVEGLYRGLDYNQSCGWQIAPAYEDEFVIYNSAIHNDNKKKYATMFRHKKKRILWIGDGGFLSSESGNATATYNQCPFVTTGSPYYLPAPTSTNWGLVKGEPANNARIFANIMNWALGCPPQPTP